MSDLLSFLASTETSLDADIRAVSSLLSSASDDVDGGGDADGLSARISDAVGAQKSFDAATSIRRAVDSEAARMNAESGKRLTVEVSALRVLTKRLSGEREENGETLRALNAEMTETRRSLQRALTRVDELSTALAARDMDAATALRRLRDAVDERDNISEMYRRATVTTAASTADAAALRSALTDMTTRAMSAESEVIRERSTLRRSDLIFAVEKRRSDVALIALLSAVAAYIILAANANTQCPLISYHM